MCVGVFAVLTTWRTIAQMFAPPVNPCVFTVFVVTPGSERVESDDGEAARGGGSEAAAVGGVPAGSGLCWCTVQGHWVGKSLKNTFLFLVFQAQKTVADLQAQLDLLKVSAESPQPDSEDVAQLKVC